MCSTKSGIEWSEMGSIEGRSHSTLQMVKKLSSRSPKRRRTEKNEDGWRGVHVRVTRASLTAARAAVWFRPEMGVSSEFAWPVRRSKAVIAGLRLTARFAVDGGVRCSIESVK